MNFTRLLGFSQAKSKITRIISYIFSSLSRDSSSEKDKPWKKERMQSKTKLKKVSKMMHWLKS